MLRRTTSTPEGPPLVPSRRHHDPLAPPRRGFLLGRLTAARRSVPPEHTAVRSLAPATGVSGAVDAATWKAALDRAAADPRATPLSAVRILIEAPALTGADRGDELARLQAISAVRWREILRPADTLAQVGPSEFAVLLPRCDGASAEAIAGRLQQAVPDAARSRAGVATSARGDAQRLCSDAVRALDAATRRTDPLADPDRVAAVEAVRGTLGGDGTDAQLDAIAASVATLADADAVVITLVDDARLHLAGTHGLHALDAQSGTPVELALCRQAVASGHPVLVSDTTRHGVAGAASAELALGVSACASVPVRAGGAIVGTVCALRRDRYEWTADDTAVLRVAADRAEQRIDAALRLASRSAITA